MSLFEQLCLEEALLRADTRNWVVVRGGVPPCIVMGISGDLHSLVDVDAARAAGVPVMRRFSGGGTVVVDESTAFVSLIGDRGAAHGAPAFPRELMAWSASLYARVFPALVRGGGGGGGGGFALREHDYALGDAKVGGNAQALSRERFVHHTSFLWDASAARLDLLRLPPKRPAWRADRAHAHFVGRLRERGVPSVDALGEAVVARLREDARALGGARVVDATLEDALTALPRNERRSNSWVVPPA
jgi:lipoate-protein ligase A